MEIFGVTVLVILGVFLALAGLASVVAAFDTSKNDAESTRHAITAVITLLVAALFVYISGNWLDNHYDIVRVK